MSETFSERALMLGADRALASIVTRPAGELSDDRPAMVLLNTGILHRVGHHRMYVMLARRLARRGHPVVRFDFPGVGDSPPRKDALNIHEANFACLKDIVDWIEATLGVKRVVLLGLCSGADYSLAYAARDPRVAGVVLLDPSIPRTLRFRVIRALRLAARPAPWINLLTGRGQTWRTIRRMLGLVKSDAAEEPSDGRVPFARANVEHPDSIDFLERSYQAVVDRGSHILAVFTAGPEYQHNYRTQIYEGLPRVRFGRQLDLHYYADCDHTFTYRSLRERLFSQVERWLDESFRADERPAPANDRGERSAWRGGVVRDGTTT